MHQSGQMIVLYHYPPNIDPENGYFGATPASFWDKFRVSNHGPMGCLLSHLSKKNRKQVTKILENWPNHIHITIKLKGKSSSHYLPRHLRTYSHTLGWTACVSSIILVPFFPGCFYARSFFWGHPKACPNSIPDLAKDCKRYALRFVCLFVCLSLLYVLPENFPPNQLALLDEFSFFQDTACSRSQIRPNQQGHCDLHRSTWTR